MNVRLAKPFGVRVGELVDRLEALSYRADPSLDRKSNCIVPAKVNRLAGSEDRMRPRDVFCM